MTSGRPPDSPEAAPPAEPVGEGTGAGTSPAPATTAADAAPAPATTAAEASPAAATTTADPLPAEPGGGAAAPATTEPSSPRDAALLPTARRRSRPAAALRSPLLPGLALYTLARLPSFFEPHWYTDEAGYATTARGVMQGTPLYSGIWNNKPPLHFLTVGIPVTLAPSSEAALHVLTFATGLVALAALAWATRRLAGPRRAAAAVLVAGLLLGTPVLDAELALPESLLLAVTAWAGALLAVRLAAPPGEPPRRGLLWAVGLGVLAAAAVAYQQTAVADACAFGLVLLLSPRFSRAQLVAYVTTVVAITAAWVVAMAAVAGLHTFAFAIAGFYVQYSAAVLPSSHSGLARHAGLLGLALVLLVGGAVAARRSARPTWALAVWAGATVLVPAAAQQPFPHFLAPAVVPVTLTLATLPSPRSLRRAPVARRGAALALTAGLVLAGFMARSTGLDWVPQANTVDPSGQHTLSAYYSGFLWASFGGQSLASWQDTFDDRVGADRATAGWLRDHGLAGHRAVVWSSDAWLHLLADLPVLMPTAPIYNNEVLLGESGQVGQRVRDLHPEVVVTADDAVAWFPEIQAVLRSGYRAVVRFSADEVWLRDDLPVAAAS